MKKWSRHLSADLYDELLKLPLRYALHDFVTLQRHASGLLQPPPADGALPPGVFTMHSPPSTEAAGDAYHYMVAGTPGLSAVGYAPPLGPADAHDVIPFFIHRTSSGKLPGKIYSMHAKNLMPNFVLKIYNVEGNLFRMEEELMKIFPTKKMFVRAHGIFIYNVGVDARQVLHHWMLGLGF
ncbi:hypothetical protein STCU_02667 [Strigomonas culicis]|nr:hypothetical protein STCU_02667 [Strigomonas culicis]|eukprot:EPY32770.1 hypothetical protein STCU_02667 [Strigomonas culicis]